ncbi:unnamed protein product [Didymodactylos carnosus]|uniref:Uncharacterized protein n=1 Tax=Didymodactylos carnosus TaxID=1234261 RepID=A0A815R6T5_9BILA|nr:unnamed protein product [Didymodactylos carnosus]CAF4339252.1 unnamed protein product [Didymodactylos carnosus]
MQSISLADPLPTKVENSNADILLGNEYYGQFTIPERIKTDKQFGFLKQDDNLSSQVDLKEWWSLDTICIKDKIDCPDEEVALKQFNETIQFQDQRYFGQLPWRNEKIDLPNKK